MNLFFLLVLLIGPLLWFFFNVVLIRGWRQMPDYAAGSAVPKLRIAVIIPVRNESANILNLLQDLEAQSYPKELFEVIIANDGSTDDTEEKIRRYERQSSLQLKVLTLKDEPHSSPKKRAISQAIQQTSYDWILTTDGDCRVGSDWLKTIAAYQQTTQAALISGPVTFIDEHDFRSRIQIIEFASLVGSAAVAMFLKQPNMCNGANLSYAKSVFEQVGGFSGNETLASGDDEFLMHKIAAAYPVFFLKSPDALVRTSSHRTFRSFYHQRRRWASKWNHYTDWRVSALAIFVFMANASCILGAGLWFSQLISGWTFLSLILLKGSLEFVFLAQVVRFLRHGSTVPYIPLVQLIYPFYVCFFGLAALKKGYEWKGRKLQ